MEELTDEEITQKVIKSINDLKLAKATLKKICDKTNLDSPTNCTGKFTVIRASRLDQLEYIEKVLCEVHAISKYAYSHLKGEADERTNKRTSDENRRIAKK